MNEGLRRDAEAIFRAAVEAVMPTRLIRHALRRSGDTLQVEGRGYRLHRNVHIVAFGKAVLGMIRGVEEIVGDHLVGGYANIPVGAVKALRAAKPELLPSDASKVTLNEGAEDNMPDPDAEAGARRILEIAQRATENDLLIVLISGGGSALLPLPAEGLTLAEKRGATAALSAGGATINELNTVRKHISAVKGGQLARAAAPAQVLTLILSDVIGDPLDVIASGPTVPDTSTFQDCRDIINRLGVVKRMPQAVMERIRRGIGGGVPETPKEGDEAFRRTHNLIVGNNAHAARAASDAARQLGYRVQVLSTSLQGIAREVGGDYSRRALAILRSSRSPAPPVCIIGAGETTVQVTGTGRGGRNQELALSAALDLAGHGGVLLLSAGTDGQDGPTDAAGAFVEGDTIARARALGLDADRCLRNNDSYRFFAPLGDLFITRLTGTNVMDLQIMLVKP